MFDSDFTAIAMFTGLLVIFGAWHRRSEIYWFIRSKSKRQD